MVKKKQAKKGNKAKSKSTSKGGLFGAIIALVIVLAAVYVGYRLDPKSDGSTTPTGEVTGNAQGEDVISEVDPDAVLVTVNGEVITQAILDQRYAELPVTIQSYVTKESLLQELIDETLLNQRADELDIEVVIEEVESEIDRIGEEQGLSREEMDSILMQQGSSLEQFKNDISSQLRLQKLFEQEVPTPEISEEEILQAYEELNPVTVRHILVGQEENESAEELELRANEVFDSVEEDFSNFCDLVTMNTIDTASIATCGEYQVFKGSNFVPEFEQAALEMEVGELRIVQSQFGYHVMWKVNNASLEDVREGIVQTLEIGKSRESVSDYLTSLRENANIVYPSESELLEGNDFDIIIEQEQVETESQSTIEEVIDELPEEIITEEVIEEVPETIVEEQVQDDTLEVIDETEEELVSIEEIASDSLLSCLEDSDVQLYGAFWDSQTKKQISVFEQTPDFYVECFEQNSFRTKSASCESIRAFPTWNINGEEFLGYLSVSSLESLTGC